MDNFAEFLKNSATTLQDVVTSPDCEKAIQANFSPIFEYLAKNSQQLLSNALSLMNKIGQKSYDILVSPQINQKAIYQSIVSKNQIHPIAKQFCSKSYGQVNNLMISRFIEITSKIIQFSKEGTDLSAAYIPTLLNFSAEPDTIDFFNNIFTNGSKATVYLQNVLLQQNFVNFLANAIGQVPYPTSLNDAAMTVIGIFTIITSATKSPVLNPQITNPNVVLHLLRDFPNAPCAVKDARWQTVLALCTPNNCNVFMNILDQAIRELSNLGPYFHSYQVSCVRLLLRVASVIPNVSSKLVQLNIALLLKNILDTYPTHTFAHIAVSEAFTDTINNPILGPHIFNLLPLVANTVPNRNVFLLSSISIKIMMDLQNKSNGNQQYSQIIEKYVPKNHPCWGIIEQFKQLLNSAYGGPIEDTKADLDK